MVQLVQATFGGGTPGQDVTVAGWDPASGVTPSSVPVASGDRILYTDSIGRRCVAFLFAGPGAGATRILWTFTAQSGRILLRFRVPAMDVVPTAIEDLGGVRHSSGNMAILQIQNQALQVQNAAGSGISASRSPIVLPAGQDVWVELAVKKGTTTTDGTIGYAWYLGNDTTPQYTWESSAVNAGTADATTVFLGRSTGRTEANTIYLDTMSTDTAAAGFLGPTAPPPDPVPPTASAGGDKTGIEPWQTVTVDASKSVSNGGSGTSITSYAITQTAGPSVTITGTGPTWTYTAPAAWAGATVTFQVTVTQTGGLTASDTATHTILRATEALAGTLTPLQLRNA